MFNTPILFLIFNRLDTSLRVFAEIKKQQPKYLYIAADGARTHIEGEKQKCEEVKQQILGMIDWECELKTLFREENLGCGRAVSDAISWFFDKVEEGIILEDDCLPHSDFFKFTAELLDKHRNNPEISIISGSKVDRKKHNKDSYYYSAYTHIWGWATWRRTWQLYTYDLDINNRDKLIERLNTLFKSNSHREFWMQIFDNMVEHKTDTWDYQLALQMILNGKLSIIPNTNLISNIGFGVDATHTADSNSRVAHISTNSIYPLQHPTEIKRLRKADDYFYSRIVKGLFPVWFLKLKRAILKPFGITRIFN